MLDRTVARIAAAGALLALAAAIAVFNSGSAPDPAGPRGEHFELALALDYVFMLGYGTLFLCWAKLQRSAAVAIVTVLVVLFDIAEDVLLLRPPSDALRLVWSIKWIAFAVLLALAAPLFLDRGRWRLIAYALLVLSGAAAAVTIEHWACPVKAPGFVMICAITPLAAATYSFLRR